MTNKHDEVEVLISAEKYDDALIILNKIADEENIQVESLLKRSEIYHRKQEWGNELNDLNKVLELDPLNEVARNYKTIVMQILSFWHKDSYNP